MLVLICGRGRFDNVGTSLVRYCEHGYQWGWTAESPRQHGRQRVSHPRQLYFRVGG